jgi:hypothetical protein
VADIRIHRDAREQLFTRHDNNITPAVSRRKRAFWHGRAAPCVAITVGAGGKIGKTVIQKTFNELSGPGGEGGIKPHQRLPATALLKFVSILGTNLFTYCFTAR